MDVYGDAFPAQNTSVSVCSSVLRNINRDIWRSFERLGPNGPKNLQYQFQLD